MEDVQTTTLPYISRWSQKTMWYLVLYLFCKSDAADRCVIEALIKWNKCDNNKSLERR